jgi:hypothetical protein
LIGWLRCFAAYPPMMATLCRGRCAYGSARATLGTAKFGGGMAAPLPHTCTGTPP